MLRALSIFLFAIVISQSVGVHIAFGVLKEQTAKNVKSQIKKAVPESQLHCIVFSKNSTINWTKQDKEFRLNERLYDVVKTKFKDGKVCYYCIDDIEETLLFSNLEKLVTGKLKNKENTKAHSMVSLIVTHYIPNNANEPINYTEKRMTSKKIEVPYMFLVKTNSLDIQVPPPLLF